MTLLPIPIPHRSLIKILLISLISEIIVNYYTTKKIMKSQYVFIFNWSVKPLNSSKRVVPLPELDDKLLFFLIWNEFFDEIVKNLSPTKVVLIASLNVWIIFWSSSKNRALEQSSLLRIQSSANQQILYDNLFKKLPLHRFQLNNTAIADGCMQKFRNNLWHDSE